MREYFEMIFEEILGNLLAQLLYVVSTLYYLHELREFNSSVVGVTNPVDIMFKDDGKAWYLLGFALIFTTLAGFLIWYHVHVFSRMSGYSMLTLIFLIVISVILVAIIFKDINNPILRAAIVVIFGGSMIFTALTAAS